MYLYLTSLGYFYSTIYTNSSNGFLSVLWQKMGGAEWKTMAQAAIRAERKYTYLLIIRFYPSIRAAS